MKSMLIAGLLRKKLTQFLFLMVLISVFFFSGKSDLRFENQI